MSGAFDLILCLMILGTAGIALFVRDALAAIAFFIAFGNLMGLAWLSLGAVNVALAEIAIGAGVTGILLILARARLLALGDPVHSGDTPTWLWLGAFAACTSFAVLLAATCCLPLLNIGAAGWRGWSQLIVYPDAFRVQRTHMDAAGVMHAWDDTLIGEAWEHGPLIVSWADVQADLAAPHRLAERGW